MSGISVEMIEQARKQVLCLHMFAHHEWTRQQEFVVEDDGVLTHTPFFYVTAALMRLQHTSLNLTSDANGPMGHRFVGVAPNQREATCYGKHW